MININVGISRLVLCFCVFCLFYLFLVCAFV